MSTEVVDAAAPASPRSLTSIIARWWAATKRLYLFLLPLRFSFLALAVIAFAFLVSAQGYDIIANLAEDDPTGATPSHDGQRIGFILGIIFLALQTWYWSRQMLHLRRADDRAQAQEFPWLTTWLPRILGALSFVIAMLALWRVARNYGVPQPVAELRAMAIWLGIGLVVFLAFCVGRRRMLKGAATEEMTWRELPFVTKIVLLSNVALSLALFTWSTFFVQSTVILGSAAVVILAFALSVPIGSVLVGLGMRGGVPIFTFLLVWAVLISPLADNHVVETMPGPVEGRPGVAQTFDRWFERLQAEHPPQANGKYPVILVATEGGGIRAAYWTAAVLTSLTDTLPAFADHTFAISAVSGGALGATVYDALLIRRNETLANLEETDYTPQASEQYSLRFRARQMLSQDALAPTLAAMTQPDLLQRFIPAPILPDRQRALEGGWERAWSSTIQRRNKQDDQTFSSGFLALMKGREAHIPSLFLNGTIVETGQRIIASNLRIESGEYGELADSVDLFGAIGGDVRVSTAVANSTRFTYVSPAGTLLRAKSGNGNSILECEPGARCEHVVDGGYFENSGSATISDVLRVLGRSKYADRIQPHVIFIRFRMRPPAAVTTNKFANEVLSPVRALLAVRGSHAILATDELSERLGSDHRTTFWLEQTTSVFPLGWLLADRTRNLMDAQMGPLSPQNGANVRRIAAVLGVTQIGRDQVQEIAARGERAPKYQE
ncbi:MAG TPA: hypothetical protein VFO89_08555 [Thermoanaerobaculia bacterium]|nr:hypothetical protein [Thermoanaerobaculia bacterium]